MMSAYSVAPYRAPWWLRGPHAQTIAGRFLRRTRPVALRRERVPTPDGDFIDLDFAGTLEDSTAAPVVLVLHGLEGGSSSSYIRNTLAELRSRGMVGVAMNFRSCGGEINRTARFYHAGETADMGLVLELLRARAPRSPLGAIGFSLGGNVLLKYLGENDRRAERLPGAAVAISVPFDLAAGARKLEQGMGRVYSRHFLRRLRHKAEAKAEHLADSCQLDQVRAARTLREFDDAATAPLHGFRDATHYYSDSSAASYLHRIGVPTLILHSLDDPFLPEQSVPLDALRGNPALVEGIVPTGGHVGFVAGPPWAPEFWAEREAARFLAAHLGGEP